MEVFILISFLVIIIMATDYKNTSIYDVNTFEFKLKCLKNISMKLTVLVLKKPILFVIIGFYIIKMLYPS